MALLRAIVLVLLLGIAAAGAIGYYGVVDVGADVPHSPIVYGLLQTALQRSIVVHAEDVVAPPLSDPKMIAEGAEHYAAMCAGCHLAPGAQQTEIRRGLYPRPPQLADGRPLPPAQAFWVVKHGIKLTAMPAWGTTHSDAEIWNIVAFLQKLPGMTADEYQQLAGASSANHSHVDHEHHADHEHDAQGDQPGHDDGHDQRHGNAEGG